MSLNRNLHKAKRGKNDEFYTQRADVEREMRHYKDHFRGKVVYCNCDDPRISEFTRYFRLKFKTLGLKKLITTCYKSRNADLFSAHDSERAAGLVITADNLDTGGEIFELDEDGDFRSAECVALLREADIVVTNPPFSLFREYVAQLVEHDKRFLIIGSKNAITYKEIFPLIRDGLLWLGAGFSAGNAFFRVADVEVYRHKPYFDADTKTVKFRNVGWFTNLDHRKRHEDILLWRRYRETPELFPKYDNYDAINVDRVADIPEDYDGAMGVPITFLDKFNPEQFEVLGITDRDNNSGLKTKEYTPADVPNPGDLNRRGVIRVGDEHKPTYVRLLIRRVLP